MQLPDKHRFWTKVKKTDTCWNWIASLTTTGYGQIGTSGGGVKKTFKAHRISWEFFHCSIPVDKLVLHKCDNKLCVNPEHLYLGTYKDNTRDAIERGLWKPENPHVFGERQGSSKLTDAKVIEARQLRSEGWYYRQLARKYGVSSPTIFDAVTGKSWKHLSPSAP